ncbi:MFS transporter [Gammaproteobacteria bacterium]|nr:MFS transporter [Gammaproteobacteria bacterium]MDB2444874.1 MFS transporter [Gammaproteobacteria bacterium]
MIIAHYSPSSAVSGNSHMRKPFKTQLSDPITLLFLLAIGNTVAFATWQVLLNNFVVERIHFSGEQIGILQSLREVPGFLAFTAVWIMLILRQQFFALVALFTLGFGTAITAVYPSATWLYFSTVVMSIGFHYLETLQTSLSLQWLSIKEAPHVMGQLLSAKSLCNFLVLGTLYIYLARFSVNYSLIYISAGTFTAVLAVLCFFNFPKFSNKVEQRKTLFLKKTYWLYYLLTFLAGARRQIFVVFAGFLLVEKFDFPVANMVLLTLINSVLTFWIAPKLGKLITKIGERRALTLEYSGLVLIFLSYAFVENISFALMLYLFDHLLFALAIAIKTYFQKIAAPEDIAATSSISFTINHIAAVVLPAILGAVWVFNNSAVFLVGAIIALCSLGFSQLIPDKPEPMKETKLTKPLSF